MLRAMLTLGAIRDALSDYEPRSVTANANRRAAVALILREGERGPEVLFIERATRDGDPWSGHMAFPGGRLEDGDPHLRAAAVRETLEEVGVDLADAEILGQLDDMEGHHAADTRMLISAFAFLVRGTPDVSPNHEVRQAFWFPVGDLLDPDRHVDYPMERFGVGSYPGILVGLPDRHVVWGLTYKFLEVFLHTIGHPLPDRWGDLPEFIRPPHRQKS